MYTLPLELQKSYLDSANYPENLILSGIATYKSRLTSYKRRLDDAESDLCLAPHKDDVEKDFEVPMIDLGTGDGKRKLSFDLLSTMLRISVRDRRNIHTPTKVTEWLGVTVAKNSNDSSAQPFIAQKRDPRCRFMYDRHQILLSPTLTTQISIRTTLARPTKNDSPKPL